MSGDEWWVMSDDEWWVMCGRKCFNKALNTGTSDGGIWIEKGFEFERGNSLVVNEPVRPRSWPGLQPRALLKGYKGCYWWIKCT